MPEKKKRSSGSKKTSKRIKKKKRDRFVTNAVIISCAAIAVVAVANIAGQKSDTGDKATPPSDIAQHYGETYTETDKTCRFEFLNVGQGDSTLITTPNGSSVLVDTGTAASRDYLTKHLENNTDGEIELLILTHPHSDHIGGAQKVLEKFEVKYIVMPDVVSTTTQFEKLCDAIAKEKEEGCVLYSAEPGDIYEIDGCTLRMTGPWEINEEELNNCSASFMFTYGSFDALFTGDSEKKAEKLMLFNAGDLDCELYKVAHHGADTSSCEEMVNAMTPQISVVSCGKDNSYGHPSTEIVQRLNNAGSAVFVTSEVGTVTVTTDGEGYSVITER